MTKGFLAVHRPAHSSTARSVRLLALAAPLVVVACGLAGPAQAAVAPVSAAPSRVTLSSSWFHDPLTAIQRAALVAVPDRPRSVQGKPQNTRALWKSHGGALAVPAITAVGHQLQQGQGVTLSRRHLFAAGSARPTMATRARVATLALSLGKVTAVTCEGYTDFGGTSAREDRLAAKRAASICRLLEAAHPGLGTTTRGFGRHVPVVVGGKASQRAANRRVVVLATAVTPVTNPPADNPPPVDPPQQATVPGAPTLSSVVAGVNAASLTFAAPADDGGSPVTGYEWSTDQTTWTPLTTAGSSPYTVQLGSLLAGTATYYVRAVNAIGNGPGSTGSSATVTDPVTVPGAPSLDSVTGSGLSASLGFTAPASDGGSPVTGYEWSTDQTTWTPMTTTGSSPFSVGLTSLPVGTETYYVRAVNAIGNGPASAGVSGTVLDVPTAPETMTGVAMCQGTTYLNSQFNVNVPSSHNSVIPTGVEFSMDSGQTWLVDAGQALLSGYQWRFHLAGTDVCTSRPTSFLVRFTSANGPSAVVSEPIFYF